eukprot:Pgem_evm1s18924
MRERNKTASLSVDNLSETQSLTLDLSKVNNKTSLNVCINTTPVPQSNDTHNNAFVFNKTQQTEEELGIVRRLIKSQIRKHGFVDARSVVSEAFLFNRVAALRREWDPVCTNAANGNNANKTINKTNNININTDSKNDNGDNDNNTRGCDKNTSREKSDSKNIREKDKKDVGQLNDTSFPSFPCATGPVATTSNDTEESESDAPFAGCLCVCSDKEIEEENRYNAKHGIITDDSHCRFCCVCYDDDGDGGDDDDCDEDFFEHDLAGDNGQCYIEKAQAITLSDTAQSCCKLLEPKEQEMEAHKTLNSHGDLDEADVDAASFMVYNENHKLECKVGRRHSTAYSNDYVGNINLHSQFKVQIMEQAACSHPLLLRTKSASSFSDDEKLDKFRSIYTKDTMNTNINNIGEKYGDENYYDDDSNDVSDSNNENDKDMIEQTKIIGIPTMTSNTGYHKSTFTLTNSYESPTLSV